MRMLMLERTYVGQLWRPVKEVELLKETDSAWCVQNGIHKEWYPKIEILTKLEKIEVPKQDSK